LSSHASLPGFPTLLQYSLLCSYSSRVGVGFAWHMGWRVATGMSFYLFPFPSKPVTGEWPGIETHGQSHHSSRVPLQPCESPTSHLKKLFISVMCDAALHVTSFSKPLPLPLPFSLLESPKSGLPNVTSATVVLEAPRPSAELCSVRPA